MKKKRHLLFWILFPIGWSIITALLVFYFDLANGPIVFFILELVLLVAFFIARVLFRDRKILIRLLTWVSFIALTVAFVSLSTPTTVRKSAAYYSNPEVINEALELNEGKVKGFYNQDKTVRVYVGIPYAKAPIGELRWKEPQPLDNWSGVRECNKFAPRSMQPTKPAAINSLVEAWAIRLSDFFH